MSDHLPSDSEKSKPRAPTADLLTLAGPAWNVAHAYFSEDPEDFYPDISA